MPWGKIILGALVIGTVYAAAKYGAGGGGAYSADSDYSWRWDAFLSDLGQPVWACRGVQSGQFADGYRCTGQPLFDTTWPGP